MTTLIRRGVPADIDAIFAIRTGVTENHLSLAELTELGVTHASATADLARDSPTRTWVAERDGAVLGFATARIADGSLFGLFVRAEAEGQGIGAALVAPAEDFLFSQHTTLWLETDGASRARGFYERLGWRVTASLPDGDVRMEKTRTDGTPAVDQVDPPDPGRPADPASPGSVASA